MSPRTPLLIQISTKSLMVSQRPFEAPTHFLDSHTSPRSFVGLQRPLTSQNLFGVSQVSFYPPRSHSVPLHWRTLGMRWWDSVLADLINFKITTLTKACYVFSLLLRARKNKMFCDDGAVFSNKTYTSLFCMRCMPAQANTEHIGTQTKCMTMHTARCIYKFTEAAWRWMARCVHLRPDAWLEMSNTKKKHYPI